MIERKADLWTYPDADLRCITTNGYVNKAGECVMGRGTALQAKNKWPELPQIIGDRIIACGNHVSFIPEDGALFDGRPALATFPVKGHWSEDADLKLIRRSVTELVDLVDDLGFTRVVLPRPGCGNGRLRWEVVGALLDPQLDDRFIVVHV